MDTNYRIVNLAMGQGFIAVMPDGRLLVVLENLKHVFQAEVDLERLLSSISEGKTYENEGSLWADPVVIGNPQLPGLDWINIVVGAADRRWGVHAHRTEFVTALTEIHQQCGQSSVII